MRSRAKRSQRDGDATPRRPWDYWPCLLPLGVAVLVMLSGLCFTNLFLSGAWSAPWLGIRGQSVRLELPGQPLPAARSPQAKEEAGPAMDPQVRVYDLHARKLAGRYRWGAMTLLYQAVCLGAIGMGVILGRRALREHRHIRDVVVACALLFGLAVGTFIALSGNIPTTVQMVRQTMVPDTHDIRTMGLSPDEARANVLAADVARSAEWLNGLGIGIAVFLSLVAGMALAPPRKGRPALWQLACRVQWLQSILYIGTAMLIIAVLQRWALLQWALVYAEQRYPPLVDGLTAYANSVVTFQGVYSSVLLASIYLPSAFLLRARATDAVGEDVPVEERDGVLKKNGCLLTPTEMVPRIAAILSPLLAGQAADLLTHLR